MDFKFLNTSGMVLESLLSYRLGGFNLAILKVKIDPL